MDTLLLVNLYGALIAMRDGLLAMQPGAAITAEQQELIGMISGATGECVGAMVSHSDAGTMPLWVKDVFAPVARAELAVVAAGMVG